MKISTAYDAYWFLYEHPKMQCFWSTLVPEDEVPERRPRQRIRVVKDELPWLSEKRYRIREHTSSPEMAFDHLNIFYAKVDEKLRVNDDRSKNVFTEVWLELGPIRYIVNDGKLHLETSHDMRLDCGAPTFDEALVKLARKVRKHYGDIKTPKWFGFSK